MLRKRIIPSLLIRNKGLVKTKRFTDAVYLGDPINAIKIFNEKEIDELVIFDIDASKNGKGIDWPLLSRINREAFMPLGYGGGIKSVDDIKSIINLGYEKIILNSIIHTDRKILETASKVIGSQSVVACVDILKNKDGFKVYDHVHQRLLDADILSFIKEIENCGAGEIIIQSVDRDGTYSGYETKFTENLAGLVSIPVIALGGASSLEDIKEVLNTNISAASAGSIFVYYGRLKAVLINYPSEDDIRTKILGND